jgi:hypothetical protein
MFNNSMFDDQRHKNLSTHLIATFPEISREISSQVGVTAFIMQNYGNQTGRLSPQG